MKISPDCRLYGILDLGYVSPSHASSMASQMIEGGVDILQLRAKSQSLETIRKVAKTVLPICQKSNIPFLLNDNPHLGAEIGADGAHVGQDDMPIAEARRIMGPDALIGLSTHSLPQALAACAEKPDYIGFGPLFATPTKPDYPAVGLEDISTIRYRIPLPVFFIGGIDLTNLRELLSRGVERAVIVSAILQAKEPAAYCSACAEMLHAPPCCSSRKTRL